MKKGLWKRRAFAFLVAAAMVIPQGVYAADPEGNEAPENVITGEVLERVHVEGCTLAPNHEGDCEVAPAEKAEETQPEKVHVEGCTLPSDHEGECEVEEKTEEMAMLKAPQDARAGETRHDIGNGNVELDNSCGENCPGHIITGSSTGDANKIIVNGGTHTITLENVTINPDGFLSNAYSAMDITDNAEVTLILEGNNTLNGHLNHPGIWVDAGTSLTIEGTGSLYAAALGGTAGNGAAGIGSGSGTNTNFGDITINSGTVEAYGTVGGAGIGGGYETGNGTAAGDITINGGYVKAVGGSIWGGSSAGAGIGAGENANYGGTITITGGVVYAKSGKDDMPSIGGGGHITGDVSHGTFSTGSNGNAVIVAPNGIGANQNAAEWDGIFASRGSNENTVRVENGTVVLNDNDANIQVWGDPVLDYDLTIEDGTTLKIHKDDRGVNNDVSLTMEKESTLTNNGTIVLGSSKDETSYLILEGGVKDTDGNGMLNCTKPSAVKLPLTDELVTMTNDDLTYNGKEQTPTVTVNLDLWKYKQDFSTPEDYSETYNPAESKDAGEYEITLKSTGTGNLLDRSVTKGYKIKKADFNVGMPSKWSVQVGETQLLSKLPTPNISIDSNIQDDMSGLKAGTLEWFTDEDRRIPVTDEYLKDKLAGKKITIYGKYSHNDGNFISPKTGSLEITMTKYKVPNVSIYEEDTKVTQLVKTYGDLSVNLNAKIKLGNVDESPKSEVTWTSNNPGVVSVDENGTVTFLSKGNAIITATVAEHDTGNPDTSYAQAQGRVEIVVNPKEITVNETNLTLNGVSENNGTFTWPYDGITSIPVGGVTLDGVISDDDVTVNSTAVLDNANEGKRTATITYTLTGIKADNYKLVNNLSTKEVIITDNPANMVVLSYDANGGNGSMNSQRVHKGDQVTVSANTFTRDHYIFDGWNTQPNGNGTSYKAGDTFVIDQNVVLYAQWKSDGSSGGDGGSSSSGGGSYTSNTYWVRYHNDDDTERDGKFIPGETVTVKGNVFTAPVGKVLAGWSLEEDGKVDYKVGDTFRMPGSSVDLYAVWKDAETESHSAYISGYPDGTVGPDKTITRAEAATMFYNLLADKTSDAKTFTDVPANQWYAKAVMTLAGKGVISGYPDGTFKPDASITRAEFVTMAMNFANAEKGTACSFPDVPQNMWYYGAIAGATQNGWISGYPDGTFGPDRYITRAEVTSVINRMENRAADMSFMMDHLDELRTFSDLGFGHWAYSSMMEAANGHDYTRADQNSYESWVDIH
ncbi:S-layer homology domain-containing protein [Anaerotignum lactatifermentans]|nr:S-layer homology domain-containing protein [Anaerotignum lactatifermentans]